jgi:hypothetical protein
MFSLIIPLINVPIYAKFAQVDGQRVVVKVQRPGLKELFDIDLKNVRVLAQWLQKVSSVCFLLSLGFLQRLGDGVGGLCRAFCRMRVAEWVIVGWSGRLGPPLALLWALAGMRSLGLHEVAAAHVPGSFCVPAGGPQV